MKIYDDLIKQYGIKKLDCSLTERIVNFFKEKGSQITNEVDPEHRKTQKFIYENPERIINSLEKILYKGMEVPLGETVADVLIVTDYNIYVCEVKKNKRKGRGIAGVAQLKLIHDLILSKFRVRSRLFSIVSLNRKKGQKIKEKILY